jgi:hypothetical protein
MWGDRRYDEEENERVDSASSQIQLHPERMIYLILSMRLGSDHSTRVLPLVLVMRLAGSMALLLIRIRMMALSVPCTSPSNLSLTLRPMLLLLLMMTLLMMSPRISRLRLRWVLVVPGMLSVRTLLLMLLLLILVILAPRAEDRLHDLEYPQDDSRHGKLPSSRPLDKLVGERDELFSKWTTSLLNDISFVVGVRSLAIKRPRPLLR